MRVSLYQRENHIYVGCVCYFMHGAESVFSDLVDSREWCMPMESSW